MRYYLIASIVFFSILNLSAQDSIEKWPYETIKVAIEDGNIPHSINDNNDGVLHGMAGHLFNGVEEAYELIHEVTAHGVSANSKNNDGNTPLHLSVLSKNEALTKALIRDGANINIKNNEGYTPFYLALKTGDLKTVGSSILVANLHFKDAEGNNPLHYAMQYNDANLIRLLLSKMKNIKHFEANLLDKTPLHVAIENGNAEAIKALAGVHDIPFYNTDYKEMNLFEYAKFKNSKKSLQALKYCEMRK